MSNQRLASAQVECCAPLGVTPISAEQADRITVLLKALADPIRLRLMSMIATVEEICVCDLLGPFEVSQPTISHHLKVLREAGLVDCERRGTWVYYRAEPDTLEVISGVFTRVPATAR